MTDPIVELRGVTKRYGEHAALQDFSLQVRRGEFLTMLGPSGSGKTTILRLVAGFEEPQAGEIFIEGKDAANLPPYRRNVNTVFQHFALFPHLNVFQNVAFGLERKKLARDEIRRRVRNVLELVELPGVEDRSTGELSGGEKQRVALARALVLEPAVLLLDEPLGALDEKLRKQMQVELKRLHARLGITFIFVTHDQQEALVMSDRIAVLSGGRLEQLGTGEEIYERPRTRFVAEFMGVENFFEARLVAQEAAGSRFETSSGLHLWAENTNGVALGCAATLAIRPQALRLSLAPPHIEMPNGLAGEVIETIYEGGSRRWVVQLPTGERLVARDVKAANGSAPEIASRARVHVSWEPRQTLVFPILASES